MTLDEVLSRLHIQPLPSDGLTLLSGGAEGADALFDALMAEYAAHERCIHWSFEGHSGFKARPEGRIEIPNSLAAVVSDARLQVAASRLGQSVPKKQHVKALFRRNVFQVLWADAVYAIAWEDLEARYPLRIGGGTKWAAQAYIDRFQPLGPEPVECCNLFFFEVNSCTWRKWNQQLQRWHILNAAPHPLRAPLRFAGIGSQTLPEEAFEAVTNLFRNTAAEDAKAEKLLVCPGSATDALPCSADSESFKPSVCAEGGIAVRKRRWQRVNASESCVSQQPNTLAAS